MKLTPWFPPYIKPVHVGVYRVVSYYNEVGYSYWTGFVWMGVGDSVCMALGSWYPSKHQAKSWRGVVR